MEQWSKVMRNDTRQSWEVAWSIHLQVAASYIRRGEKWLGACKIGDRVTMINEVITRANALVEEHGAPGTAALNAAADSLAALRLQEPNGIVPIAGTMRTKHTERSMS